MLGYKDTSRLDKLFEKTPTYRPPSNPKDNFNIELNLKSLIENEKAMLLKCKVNSDEFNYRWFLLHRLFELNESKESNRKLVEFLIDKGLFEEYLDYIR